MSMALASHTQHGSPTSLTLLGSTGTIGQNTLKFIMAHPGHYTVDTLTAGENVALLAQQARMVGARHAVIANPALYGELQNLLHGTGISTAAGEEAVVEAASRPTELVMSAIVGAAALRPTLAAITRGARVALANKECLVCAGDLVMQAARKHNATLLPVDSEHSAIFQLLDNKHRDAIDSITITASGGPFREYTLEAMKNVTPEQAVRHPNWAMGAKISVDSATLMNKGLELIEAYHLFGLRHDQWKVLVHPESIVHCLVSMVDGSVLAQLSNPDMITPIAVALSWPERKSAPVRPLQLEQIGTLRFSAPDTTRFPALKLAQDAMLAGGSAPTVLNAANEIAVGRFLAGEIGFLDIARTVERTLEALPQRDLTTLDEVMDCDTQARRIAKDH
jgi:1-deoxy-D-xylulose-5-phosphate reductoisomerase